MPGDFWVVREPIRCDGPWPLVADLTPFHLLDAGGCVPLLDTEYFCSFSYIWGLDP